MNKNNSEVIIYRNTDGAAQLSVHLENEDVWLTQKQLTALYQAAKSTVSEHIKNIYADEELTPEATVRKIRTVQKEGSRAVSRELEHYNLVAAYFDLAELNAIEEIRINKPREYNLLGGKKKISRGYIPLS